MNLIPLRTNRTMPPIGFGTWQLHGQQGADAVAAALKAGYRMIDASGSYGNLPAVGEGIARTDEHGVRREEICFVTKIEADEEPVSSLAGQLEQAGLERADLTLIHWPPPAASGGDVGTDLWEGLIKAREQGLTVDIGVSNYNAKLLDELIDATGEVPAVNQIEWSPFGHSMAFREYLRGRHIAIQAYSPLAQYAKLDDPVLREVGKAHTDKHGGSGSGAGGSAPAGRPKTPGQVVLRWDVQLGIAPLPRSGTPAHIAENFDVADFELSDKEMERITALNEKFSVIAARHNMPGLNYL